MIKENTRTHVTRMGQKIKIFQFFFFSIDVNVCMIFQIFVQIESHTAQKENERQKSTLWPISTYFSNRPC